MSLAEKLARGLAHDTGCILASWALAMAIEDVGTSLAHRRLFAGWWEMNAARMYLAPVALASLLAPALALAAFARVAGWSTEGSAAARRGVMAIGLSLSAALAWGLSHGRHFERLPARLVFVATAAILGAVALAMGVRVARRVGDRALALGGVTVALVAAWLDLHVLPRLYPALHVALFLTTLGGLALVAAAARRWRHAPRIARGALLASAAALVWAPHAARAVAPADNLRLVLAEHAPILGRAAHVAALLAPPPALDDDATLGAVGVAEHAPRSLDWTGRDVVLVTVDALRADHVSAFGYRRPTTPNIDAIAARGARFDAAYCATPHTSYSIASLMTGKYMRPLVAMGVGDDPETWADHMRRYGYRTAAFYPPAVFFIDGHRFAPLRDRGLGFEYRKVEFAERPLRVAQVRDYLEKVSAARQLFLWVHLFEPHEPYEVHAGREFSGDRADVDAYDSEIAEADATVGEILDTVRRMRREPVVILTADHGEELGDHGGRYHGSSVYEEQVRVPLVISGPGVEPRVVREPVQTVDLLPTALSALGVPRPARIRGRDLGPLIGKAPAPKSGGGFAYAETDGATLIAEGPHRLVCQRTLDACALYDVERDPGQTTPLRDRPDVVARLRKARGRVERDHGILEGTPWPDALRRGIQGNVDAAEEVATLLDDAKVEVRRAAAHVLFRLRAPSVRAQVARAATRDEDDEVRRHARLALVRMGDPVDDAIASLLRDDAPRWRRAAALAMGERGDSRGASELVAWWTEAFGPDAETPGEIVDAETLLDVLGKLRAREAVPALVGSLGDVRLRPQIFAALAAIGDVAARRPMLEHFREERFLHARPVEARALVTLGARGELLGPLARFAGVPEPMGEAAALARDAGLLSPSHGGATSASPLLSARVAVGGPEGTPQRLWVVVDGDASGRPPEVRLEGAPLALARAFGTTFAFEAGRVARREVTVEVRHGGNGGALWLVPHAPELPPPPKEAWDAGAPDETP